MKTTGSIALPGRVWSGILCVACMWAAIAFAETDKPGKGAQNVTDTVTMQKEVEALENAFTNTFQKLEKRGESRSSGASELLWLIAGAGLLGTVVLIKYIPGLLEVRDVSYQARLAAAKAAVQVHPHMVEEEKAFVAFAQRFHFGPAGNTSVEAANEDAQRGTVEKKPKAPATATAAPPATAAAALGSGSGLVTGPIEVRKPAAQPKAAIKKVSASESRMPCPPQLAAFRELVQELTAATKEEEKQSAIARLMEEVEVFKTAAQAPEWLPAWKVASALEAMLKQLAGKPHSLNPSTLRTTAAAVDLIHTLSQPGIRPDLVTEPPVRVLAVDDDRISRHAISFTLKQTLNLPELADNGVTGLKLATQNAYDAIFLDVQMPDLNGFELCARIRETELNGQTPVVFVTCHNDFSARAKSTAAGGQDLIGKPFLTFEMGLKALTLVLQRRLNKTEAPEQEVAEAEPVELAAAVQ